MYIGDKVIVEEIITKIIATAYDDNGITVYMVDGSSKDYYENELELL